MKNTDAGGNLMVLAELADDEVGLWWIPAGTTTPILQLLTGQMVDVFGNGTDVRPIDDIAMSAYFGGPQSGINRLLNDNGDFVVHLNFAADANTRPLGGLYISTVAVPEPTTLAAITLGSVGLMRRRRRSF